MRALLYDGELRLLPDYPRPKPPPGEALIRVSLAGICNTDLEIAKGYMGFQGVLGHEFVGIVEEAEKEWLGKRVVGEINCYCGECPLCRRGLFTHCPERTTLGIWGRDGAFAEYLTLPLANLHPVPEEIPDEDAVFVEPLAAALEIVEQIPVKPTDRVILLGDGKLGLLVAQVLALQACDLLAVGHHAHKLEILKRRGIATHLGEGSLERSFDIVVDCTGNPEGFAQALALLRPRGTLVLKSTYHGETEVDLSHLVIDEITLIGSRCGPLVPALELLRRGLVDVASLISATLPLDEGIRAFQLAEKGETLKVLLRP
ncbi:MAG: alcohol dehydrogenase catalytic domain-containing protein, partial [Anaerolineae bacterium]